MILGVGSVNLYLFLYDTFNIQKNVLSSFYWNTSYMNNSYLELITMVMYHFAVF
jgi:hypothetical protein